MPKKICETKDKDKLKEKQKNPVVRCKKCKEKASDEKYVCKPEKL